MKETEFDRTAIDLNIIANLAQFKLCESARLNRENTEK